VPFGTHVQATAKRAPTDAQRRVFRPYLEFLIRNSRVSTPSKKEDPPCYNWH